MHNGLMVGVFDTGKGGRLVADQLASIFPEAQFEVVDDALNAPYGTKSNAEIRELSIAAVQPLINRGCQTVVVACNTATTVAISALRETYPDIHFIGMEPMVKPAALATQSGTIAVLATPATLRSQRYRELKDSFASEVIVHEPDCTDWAELIQQNNFPLEKLDITADEITSAGCDQIVIACTHYLDIINALRQRLPEVVNIQDPIPPIANRLRQLSA